MSEIKKIPDFDYDVFISYSSHDKDWVRNDLLSLIEQAGFSAFIDFRDFKVGVPGIKEMERGVSSCRKTVLVLTPDYIDSEWCEIENIMLSLLDPANRELRLIPILKNTCSPPLRIRALTHIDYTDGADFELARKKLDDALGTPLKSSSDENTNNPEPVHHQEDATNSSTSEVEFHGKQRAALLNYFVSDWLPNGAPVAILQGFPGCGKTQLASSVAAKTKRCLNPVEPQLGTQDPSLDLLKDLALALDDEGIDDLIHELDKGVEGNLCHSLLRVLRREQILIVVDEFQRLLSDKDTLPPKDWQYLVEHLNNSPRPAGRLLLISNRTFKNARWCEKSVSRELKGLTDTEAVGFLHQHLVSKDLSEKVPVERREEIGQRLGGNPRALKTLVESLKYFTLDELISLAPDLFKTGDVVLNCELVEDFERELIERTLSCMEDELLQFMRWLSVYRRPFNKDVAFEITTISTTPQALRRQLIDRFLLESTNSGETLHPLAREISVTRLREDNDEWRQAHSLAANYYFKYFKTACQREAGKLTTSYTELRHHLFESGRMDELYLASEKLTNYALSLLPKPAQSMIPNTLETLEEHIALISALPDKKRPKGLEYHLALCLKTRNSGNDCHRALFHVRRATGPHAYYAVWLLLIDLEYELNGINAMMKAQKDAVRFLGSGSNAFTVYHRCAHILMKEDRFDDAIRLLEKAIATPGIACITSLYSLCARCLERSGKFDDAIRTLQKGIEIPNVKELGTVYIHCAGLMIRLNRLDEAILFLQNGLKLPGMTRRHEIYLLIAESLVKKDADAEAIICLKNGVSDPHILDPKMMYRYCAELLVKHDRIDEAAELLERGLASKNVKDPLPIYFCFADIMEQSGNIQNGVKLFRAALINHRLKKEPSLYLKCAKLLSHGKNIDDAIEVLKQGLQVPSMKEQNNLAQMCADLMARQGRLHEAIELLEGRIAGKDTQHLDFVYKDCSDLMVKAGRLEDAISLMKKGIISPGLTNKGVIYQKCAKLLGAARRPTEGIDLLEKALRLPGTPGKIMLFQTCADLMSIVGRNRDAIRLLKSALHDSRMGNLASLIMRCVDLLVADGQRDEAISMLNKGIADYPGDGQLKTLFEKLFVRDPNNATNKVTI